MRLKIELERLLGYLFEDLGKSPWTYVLIWYLASILIEEIEKALVGSGPSGPIAVLDTIVDILEEKNRLFAVNRLRAEEVLLAARKMY